MGIFAFSSFPIVNTPKILILLFFAYKRIYHKILNVLHAKEIKYQVHAFAMTVNDSMWFALVCLPIFVGLYSI